MKKIPSSPSAAPRAVIRTPAPADRIRTPKTAELVADHIRGLILRGELKEGGYLQPEMQLMETFSVSRPTLREAFRILENEGFISVVRGSRSGARVHAPSISKVSRYATFMLQGQRAELKDVYDAREIIEPALVAALADDHTPAQIAALRAAIQAGHDALEAGDRRATSVAVSYIHKVIVEQYGNKSLGLFANMLQHIVEQHQASMGAQDTDSEANYRKRVGSGVKSMTKLVDFIEAGDAVGAAEHWRLHLKNAKKRWLSGHDRTTLLDLFG